MQKFETALTEYCIDRLSDDSFLMRTNDQGYQAMESSRSSYCISESTMGQKSINKMAGTKFTRLLTVRESEILAILGKGLSMKGAARELAISPGTVKWHVKNMYEKLGATSREDALGRARLQQLIR